MGIRKSLIDMKLLPLRDARFVILIFAMLNNYSLVFGKNTKGEKENVQ